MKDEALIGIRAAARQAGIAHSTLSRQVTRGQVRSHGGKVRLSEVLYDRKHNLDPTIWLGRKKKPTKPKIEATGGATSRNGATVHDDGAAHAPACRDFAPERVTEFGLMLDLPHDRMTNPAIVASVMSLTGLEMILGELGKLGWRRDDPRPAADDNDPIGPHLSFSGNGEPLNIGLIRRLGCVLQPTDPREPRTDPNDPAAVAEDMLLLALDILDEELKRRRVALDAERVR
jgi:hypothetical protein